jgi:serine/threonine protein kinase
MSSRSDPASHDPDDLDGLGPGSRVGRYTLVARLASGGMAHVWTAEPGNGSGLGRMVAVKVIRSELAKDLEYARMFIDEATIACAIEHPNVCQTYELDRHEGSMFMAMEWVPGDSLGGLLREGDHFAPLELAVAVRICADACAGLHAAHEALDENGQSLGVIHRDVSPPNILISLQGQVKVSDFGIAKARHQLHERTKTGEVKGKFGYLAPEQITGKGGDRRIDIYAMGCVLYVATMGLRPFGNGPKAMTKILLGEYRKPSEIDPMYPPGLEAIVVRALAHEPTDRFQSAGEMREALEKWLVDARQVVTATDVARALTERMNPKTLEDIRNLQSRRRGNRAGFGALLDAFDELEPPTAASGVMVPPVDLAQKAKVTPRLEPEQLLEESNERTMRTPVRASLQREGIKPSDDQSGWKRARGLNPRDEVTKTENDYPSPVVTVRPSRSRQRRAPAKPAPSGIPVIIWQAAVAGVVFAALFWLFTR